MPTKAKKKEFRFEAEIFTPRWGHTDRYKVVMTRDNMRADTGSPKQAICKLNKDGDPVWSGHNAHYPDYDNPLVNILNDDMVYVPDVIGLALESAWEKWREGAATEEELKEGLAELFGWIDMMGRNKPNAKLWSGIF
jgi:hypothetical protein